MVEGEIENIKREREIQWIRGGRERERDAVERGRRGLLAKK